MHAQLPLSQPTVSKSNATSTTDKDIAKLKVQRTLKEMSKNSILDFVSVR
jgi:hypothetical protein